MMDDKKQTKTKATLTEVERLKKENEEWKNKYLRALADYQNFEKRVRDEKNELIKIGVLNTVLRLLPFLDHIEKAEIFIKDAGLKMIREQFYGMLKEIGVEELPVAGKVFDPHLAEAVEVVPGEKANTVIGVFRKGYQFQGRVLRVAQVKVSKTPKSS
ncbi:nucleotide exchange factor GrpE [Candidatus Roizmanbacteria bacterium]|nr:nucleotide exchange factor GrpE [Candidatus Roizmanbacteria bacterium]